MANLDRPTPFGRYELLRRIGAGGMGEVFLARLPGLAGADKVCVVKKILPHLVDDRGFVARFLDEGKVVVHLSHGNIAKVFEMGEVEGAYFMAMEYVEGKTLAKVQSRLQERGDKFPVELALLIGSRLCDGLGYAHRKTDPVGRPLQVVHRDISPSNIMLSYEGDLKIIDFGAALSTLKEEMTAPRVVIGNLAYMAPEHARKQKVDLRADLFSVGVVLWELTSQQLMPTGGDHVERWKRAARPVFEKPSTFQSSLPKEVDQIVMKALQVDIRERYQDAEMFRDDLQVALARISPATTQRKLAELMTALFDAERSAEQRLIAEAMAQPAAEPARAPDGRKATAGAMKLQAITDPHRGALGNSEPTPTPVGGEPTFPGSPPALNDDPANRATSPGRPPLFADDVEGPPAPIEGVETTAPQPPPLPWLAPAPESAPHHGTQPRGRWARDDKARLALWVGLGLLIGFVVVVALLSLGGHH